MLTLAIAALLAPSQATESVEMNVILTIHAGEGDCVFEDVITPWNPGFIECRDALREILAEMEGMGVAAEVQFQPGFLNLLHLDRSADAFDFEADLLDRGHGLGQHIHGQCLKPLDTDGSCTGFGAWGNTSGSTSPTQDVFELRARSLRYAGDVVGLGYQSFNIWGWSHRIETDLAAGDTTAIDFLNNQGFRYVVGTNVGKEYAKSSTESCYDGYRIDTADTYRAVPHPFKVTGGVGGRAYVVVYSAATPKWGDPAYSSAVVEAGFDDAMDCAHGRVVNAADTGWNGEIFTFAGFTHLHNLKEDVDKDGIYDGIEDLEEFMAAADALAEDYSDGDVTFSVVYRNVATVEAMRLAHEALGGDYDH
jgi:hypothetical protein